MSAAQGEEQLRERSGQGPGSCWESSRTNQEDKHTGKKQVPGEDQELISEQNEFETSGHCPRGTLWKEREM